MDYSFKKNLKRISYIGGILVSSLIIGISLQLVHAWVAPTLNPPNPNVPLPINVGGTAQTKTGALGVDGGITTPIIYDTNNPAYFVDPNSVSRLNTASADNWFVSRGNSGLFFETYGGGLYMTDNTWIRTYGVGNFYAFGEVQATNVKANTNLCIGASCIANWTSTLLNWNTWQYGNYFQTNGDIYMAWAGGWLQTILNGKLKLDTWQGNHYSASTGAEYATIFYDTNNSVYNLDPTGSSFLNSVTVDTLKASANLCVGGSCISNWSNFMQLNTWLTGGSYFGSNGDIYMPWAGNWLQPILNGKLQLDTWQGNHYSGSTGAEYAAIFYDTNNSGYYLDPASNSNLNGVYGTYFHTTINDSWFPAPSGTNYIRGNTYLNGVTYDENNAGYYLDMNNTSRLNYGVYDNLYAYNSIQASGAMYTPTLCLNGNCRSSWPGLLSGSVVAAYSTWDGWSCPAGSYVCGMNVREEGNSFWCCI